MDQEFDSSTICEILNVYQQITTISNMISDYGNGKFEEDRKRIKRNIGKQYYYLINTIRNITTGRNFYNNTIKLLKNDKTVRLIVLTFIRHGFRDLSSNEYFKDYEYYTSSDQYIDVENEFNEFLDDLYKRDLQLNRLRTISKKNVD